MAKYGSRGRYRMARDMASEKGHLKTAIEEVEAEQQQAEAYSTYGRTGGSLAGAYAGAALGSFVPGIGTAIGGVIGAGLGSLGGSYAGESIAASKGRQSVSTGGKFLSQEKEEAQKQLDQRRERRKEGYAFSALGDMATAGMMTGTDVAFKEGAKKVGAEALEKGTEATLWQSFKGGIKGAQAHTWSTKDVIRAKLPGFAGGKNWSGILKERGAASTAAAAADKTKLIADQSAQWLEDSQEFIDKPTISGQLTQEQHAAFKGEYDKGTTIFQPDEQFQNLYSDLEPEGLQSGGSAFTDQALANVKGAEEAAAGITGTTPLGERWKGPAADLGYGAFSSPQVSSGLTLESQRAGMMSGGRGPFGYGNPEEETLYSQLMSNKPGVRLQ